MKFGVMPERLISSWQFAAVEMGRFLGRFAFLLAFVILATASGLCVRASRVSQLARSDGEAGFTIGKSAWKEVDGRNFSTFRTLNRRALLYCEDPNPYLAISLDSPGPLNDVQEVTVTVSGILKPSDQDWIAVISPSSSDTSLCPQHESLYLETGDLASLPLLCHYPVKFQYVRADPDYLRCRNKHCQKSFFGFCLLRTCSGKVTFRLINIRTDVAFVFFTGGMDAPCVLATSDTLAFANPRSPLYSHLSSVDSYGTAMRVTWVSGDGNPQQVKWDQKFALSTVTTFSSSQMCYTIQSPATDFGWHDPGYIHSAEMEGLSPSSTYSYTYGSDAVGWSPSISFKTPPAPGTDRLTIIIYGDMGKNERDNALQHYTQPGALTVIDAVAQEVANDNVDAVFHIGDISYATGFLVEWDSFLEMINPVASRVPYMTAIGNHERDFPNSGDIYGTPDSGGECGVPYGKYFPMPAQGVDKPWYSIEFGPVHFTVMSTEHDWSIGSEQYGWLQHDLHSVDRTRAPWLVFTGHRPMYSSAKEGILKNVLPHVDSNFVAAIEPLLYNAKVDLAVWGHVHNFERTCPVFQKTCLIAPTDVDDNMTYLVSANNSAPIHVVTGTAGFTLDDFVDTPENWSIDRSTQFGYSEILVTPVGDLTQLTLRRIDIFNDGSVPSRTQVTTSFALRKPTQ